jgi:hypothetical protein
MENVSAHRETRIDSYGIFPELRFKGGRRGSDRGDGCLCGSLSLSLSLQICTPKSLGPIQITRLVGWGGVAIPHDGSQCLVSVSGRSRG